MAVRRPGDGTVSIVNRPSDGSERSVANSLMVFSSAPTGPLATITVFPNNQTIYRRITDVAFRGRLLGLRDAVVGISAPVMVVIAGVGLDLLPIRAIVFMLAAIDLTALIWFALEGAFQELNRSEPVPDAAPLPQ